MDAGGGGGGGVLRLEPPPEPPSMPPLPTAREVGLAAVEESVWMEGGAALISMAWVMLPIWSWASWRVMRPVRAAMPLTWARLKPVVSTSIRTTPSGRVVNL